MSDFEVAADIGDRMRELRSILGETQVAFGERFGRGWKQISAWERGTAQPPASVLLLAARQNEWPATIFTDAGPRPGQVLAKDVGTSGMVREPGAPYLGLQAAVNAALTDVVRWTAEGLTIEEAATRAIQLLTAVAAAARADADATARESAVLIDALRRRIGDLGEGRGAAAPAPPAKAAGGGSA